MRLSQVIDLELQLEADRTRDPDELRARDRALALEARLDDAAPAAVITGWLSALEHEEPRRLGLGAKLVSGGRILAALLVVLGVVVGSGVARLLLQYDGARPVNVLPLAGVLVLLQLALLLLVLVSVGLTVLMPGLAHHLPLAGDLRSLLGALVARLADRGRRAGGTSARWVATAHRLRARSRVHQRLEVWWLTVVAQAFGIAFNLGALAMVLLLPAVQKYSFGWSTTLELGPEALHRMTTVLSWPWSSFAPQAVPSLALIESTQYDLLLGRYMGAEAPASGGWWPFVVAALVVYGLLPRLLLTVAAAAGLRRSLRKLPLDTPDIEALLRRLRSPLVETRGAGEPGRALASRGKAPAIAGAAPAAAACTVVLWRDLPADRTTLEAWTTGELGWTVGALIPAGGADFKQDSAATEAAGSAELPVVVVAEAWEPPDKAMRRFLAGLRAAVGERHAILVALVQPRDGAWAPAEHGDVQLWSEQLAALADPYLSVESLRVPA